MMTTILAIDSATGPCSVALWANGRVVAYVENQKPVMQSASLIPMVEDALKQSGLGYKDLTCVAATVGPGSFTGIRVGLASAQGIAYAAKLPVKGFTTLDVLAFGVRKQTGPILSVLNAGKGECYYQYFFSPQEPLCAPRVGTLEQIIKEAPSLPITVAGNMTIPFVGFVASDITFPRADALAALAAASDTPLPLKPFYIRPPDAKLPGAA